MAASDVILGIDLGTTNSVVSVADEQSVRVLQTPGGDALIPSAVTFHPDGRVLVGASARERRLLDATNTVYSVKRLIGRPFESDEVRRAKSRFAFEFVQSDSGGVLVKARGETYTLGEISAFVLREVRAVAEKALGHAVRKAVVTVPANFNELQRSATKAAGRVAGLDVVRILNEPTAAALAYGHGRSLRERVAVFDLGGGTFDVTILELAGEIFEVQATAGDTYLGGDDIDNLIAEQMAEAFLVQHRLDPRTDRSAYERLRAAAEWAKCQLSARSDVRVKVEGLAYGEGGAELDLNFNLSTQSLESMAMPLLARAFDVCEEAMRIANTRPTQIDRVILVGGSTRMPLVRRMVAEYFGREPLVDIDPDLVVSQGAAIQGRSLATARARGKIGRVALRKVAPPSRIAIQEVGGGDRQSHVDATGMTLEEDDIEIIEPDDLEDEVVLIDFEGARRDGRELPAEHQPKASSPPPGATMRPPGSGPKVPPPLVPAGAIPVGAPPSPAFSSNDLPASRGAPPPVDAIPLPMDMPGMDELPMPELSMPVPTEAEPGVPPVIAQAPIVLEAPSGDLPSLDDFDMGGNALGGPVGGGSVGGSPAGGGVVEAAPPMEDERPPLLVDVTPLSLSVETVGGYCEAVIARNAAIPTEQSRAFSTAQDDQKEVILRVCQGESRRLDENQLLGEVALELPGNARRGRPIDVTFLLDAGGTLAVRAVDGQTGQEQRVRIQLIGGVDEEAAAQMAERLDAMYSPSE